MQLRRGIAPVLYHLDHDGRHVGTLTRGADATIQVGFHGFHTSAVAASAALLAHDARRAYEGELAAAAADDYGLSRDLGRIVADARAPSRPAGDAREVTAHDQGGTIHLHLGGEEIACLFRGDRILWSAELSVGPGDTPVVFALAAARRMWDALRRAGLWRRMGQWVPATPTEPVA
jgi:hypothetical protein